MTADGGWTVDTLKEFIEQRFVDQERFNSAAVAALEKSIQVALTAAQQAVNKAEAATEKRFDSVNEFRATLADQTGTLMPRAEAEIRLKTLTDRLDAISGIVTSTAGRSVGLNTGWGYLVAAVLMVSAIVGVIVGLR